MMAAILATRFPEKAPELLPYQSSIIRAERNYEGKQWVAYDRQYQREALAWKDLNWSVPNVHLYNEAFTGRARAVPRCSYCLRDYHAASACPSIPGARSLIADTSTYVWGARKFMPGSTVLEGGPSSGGPGAAPQRGTPCLVIAPESSIPLPLYSYLDRTI